MLRLTFETNEGTSQRAALPALQEMKSFHRDQSTKGFWVAQVFDLETR